MARLERSKKTNPQFSLSDLGEMFILGETAAFISILGDKGALTVDTTLVEYLFGTFSSARPPFPPKLSYVRACNLKFN